MQSMGACAGGVGVSGDSHVLCAVMTGSERLVPLQAGRGQVSADLFLRHLQLRMRGLRGLSGVRQVPNGSELGMAGAWTRVAAIANRMC